MDLNERKKNYELHKEKLERLHKELWENLKPFNTVDDVPSLPVVNKEQWENYYVPKLIQAGAIPKDKLIVGKEYIGNCRNTDVATWNGKQFEYQRYKFGTHYTDKINHFQDDNGYDLFVPINEKL